MRIQFHFLKAPFRAIGVKLFFLACLSFAAHLALTAPFASAADSFDWRNIDGTCWMNSLVQNQGNTGVCYAFACNAMMESKYMMSRNDPNFVPDLSEQQWLCTESTTGRPGLAYMSTPGIVSEAELPFTGTYPTAGWPLASGSENRVWKAVGIVVSPGNTIQAVKNQLKTLGPFMIGISTSNFLESGYEGGAHAVTVVGYQDDPTVPGGGYWKVKNSWGATWNGDGYGRVPYAITPLVNKSDVYLNAPVYYTGEMVSATWNGGAGTWSKGGGNWTKTKVNGVAVTAAPYNWENTEVGATFAGAGGAVAVSGSAIAHGMTVNSAGYSFTGGSITITAGGLAANQSVTFGSDVYIGGPQSWNAASGKTITVNGGLHTIISDLKIGGSGNALIAGAIDGGGVANALGSKTGGIIKNNSGTLTFSGPSNFDGDITVNTGTLTINPTTHATYSGAFFGSGTLLINSGDTVSIGGGASNFGGKINVQSGTLEFVPAAGITSAFTGIITSNQPVVQNGQGTTRLTALNNYAATTTIKDGALQAKSGAGLPANNLLCLDGGVLQAENDAVFTRSLSNAAGADKFYWAANGGGFSGGPVALTVAIGGISSPTALAWGSSPDDVGAKIVGSLKFNSTTATSSVTFSNAIDLGGENRIVYVNDNSASSADFAVVSGAITGSGGLHKTGPGLLCLTGTNNYGGTTTISGGVLQASFGTGIPSDSCMVLDGGVFLPDAGATFTRSMGTSGATVAWTEAGGGFAARANALTISINNNSDVIAWGASSGNLKGPLKLNASMAGNSVTLTNALDLAGGARTFDVADNADSTADCAVLSGGISDSVGNASLTKTGAGTLYLQGDGNTYAGPTTVSCGKVYLKKSSGYAIPGDLTLESNETVPACAIVQGTGAQINPASVVTFVNHPSAANYARLEVYGNDVTVGNIVGFGVIENTEAETGIGNGTITVNSSTDATFNGYLRNNGGGSGTLKLVKSGSGVLTLGGPGIAYTGGTVISGGKLVLKDAYDATFATKNITNNAALQFNASAADYTYSGAIDGSGSVEKTGERNLTIAGSSGNTYTGETVVSGGYLKLSKTSGYAIPGNLSLAKCVVLIAGETPQINPASIVEVSLEGTLELSGHTVTIGGLDGWGAQIRNYRSDPGASGSNGTLVIDVAAGGNYSFYGYLIDRVYSSSSGNKLSIVKNGPGKQIFEAHLCDGYTGGLTVNNGTLDYSGGVLPACNYTITGGTLDIGANSKAISAFRITGGTLSGTGTLTSSSAYDIQGGTVNAVLAGTNIALNKSGAGTAILAGANTYTGPTTISAGTLQVNNSADSATGTGAVGVNSGATLAGAGFIGGPVSINAGGTLAPGNSPGILTVNNRVTFSPGSFFNVEVNGLGTGYDQLKTAGPVSLGGTLSLSFGDFSSLGGDMLFLIDNTGVGTTTGKFQFDDNGKIGTFDGYDWFITYDAESTGVPRLDGGNDVAIYTLAVPEPATAALLGIAATSLLAYTLRRRAA